MNIFCKHFISSSNLYFYLYINMIFLYKIFIHVYNKGFYLVEYSYLDVKSYFRKTNSLILCKKINFVQHKYKYFKQ